MKKQIIALLLRTFLFACFLFTILSVSCGIGDDTRDRRKNPCSYTILRKNNGQYGKEQEQIFNFFEPKINGKKPLIILLHQGAFVTGSKDEALMTSMGNSFARCGIAVASIDYRLISPNSLERIGGMIGDVFEGENSIRKELYNAIRDARTAVRYFKTNATSLSIDSDQIYLMGYSAGGIVALQVAFMDEQEAKDFYFKEVIVNNQGCLDCRGDNSNISTSVKGVIAINGALLDANFISDNDTTPVFLAFGENDDLIPPLSGRPFQKFIQDSEIDLPSFKFEIGIADFDIEEENGRNKKRKRDITMATPKITIPAGMPKFLIETFTSDLYGSKYIKTNAIKCKKEIVVLPNVGHNFFTTQDGNATPQYFDVINKVVDYIQKNTFQ